MNPSARSHSEPNTPELTPEHEAAVKAVGSWVGQLARTFKTCRLYDAQNPTVLKFRQELFLALAKLIDDHGSLTLSFSADDVFYQETSIYPARSRDDNLGLAFHRDGIRTITFSPGIAAVELDALVSAVIHVTGQASGEDDLVTLLWEAHLPHVDVDYVPGEADTGGGNPNETGEMVPWPTASAEPESEPGTAAAGNEAAAAAGPGGARSDDWTVSMQTGEIEAGFEELQTIALTELARFQGEFEAERQVSTVQVAIRVAAAYLGSGAGEDDRLELARFLPRVLRQAFTQGAWREAGEALSILEQCRSREWSADLFVQELMQPISITTIQERLESQEPPAVQEFLAFVRRIGDPGIDLLCLVMPELQNSRHLKPIMGAIGELCASNPERLSPLLGDARWYVVRNGVQILGTIGGRPIVGLLQAVLPHPDARVRLEIAGALRSVESTLARPLLIRLLEGADTRMFCSALTLLSQSRDSITSRILLDLMRDPGFEKRPGEEKRAIYSAIGATAEDDLLGELEMELAKGTWFARTPEPHRLAIARCIARIGTPASKEALERGVQSKRGAVRKACEDVLSRWRPRD